VILSKGFRRPSRTPIGQKVKELLKKEDYPKKDISFICFCHKILRAPMTDEIFELVLGETTILSRLEKCIGQ
jgi:hypothetical protein